MDMKHLLAYANTTHFGISRRGLWFAYATRCTGGPVLSYVKLTDDVSATLVQSSLRFPQRTVLQLLCDQDDSLVMLSAHATGALVLTRLVHDGERFHSETISTFTFANLKVFPGYNGYILSVPHGLSRSELYSLGPHGGPVTPLGEIPGAITQCFRMDDRHLLLATRQPRSTSRVYIYDAFTTSLTVAFSLSDYSTEDVLLYDEQTDTGLCTTDVTGRKRAILCHFRHNEYTALDTPRDLPTPDQTPACLSRDSTRVAVLESSGVETRLVICDLKTKARQTCSESGVALPLVAITEQAAIFLRSAPSTPYNLIRYDLLSGRSATLVSVPAEYPVRTTLRCHRLFDSHSVESIIYEPRGAGDARANVFCLHGGPYSRWQNGFNPLPTALSYDGYRVVCPNYRGSTGYGKEFQHAIDGAWGDNDLDDLLALRQLLSQRGKKNVLIGNSYGGFLALRAIIRSVVGWDFAVLLSSFVTPSTLNDVAAEGVRSLLTTRSGTPLRADYTLSEYQAIKAKLLIIHGASDDVVPVQEAYCLIRALLRSGKIEGRDYEVLIMDGVGHSWHERADAYECVRDFLKRNL